MKKNEIKKNIGRKAYYFPVHIHPDVLEIESEENGLVVVEGSLIAYEVEDIFLTKSELLSAFDNYVSRVREAIKHLPDNAEKKQPLKC